MPPTLLAYNDNDQEHKCAGSALGTLLRQCDKGTVGAAPNSYYMGKELFDAGVVKPPGFEYRKWDVPGQGKGNRTKNRVIVLVDKETKEPIEDIAYFWRHDNRVYKLSKGFFDRGNDYRNL